ncbi:M23 family metallopeptidase [Planctomonas psychrotolerans]|uniref:M23 family metallopeptidase n=1 Tax=Planctomonas psychrotolerans TaxID=2528712 RepID=UPI00123878D0|nr:M23 family metallopeptidase [Planctomonas psychrotolerans]
MHSDTPGEAPRHVPSWSRRGWSAVVAGVASVALVLGGAIAPASADEYPSWQEVQEAMTSKSAQAALVSQVQADLAALKTEVADATALVEQRGQDYREAQQAVDDKSFEASELQRQADEAAASAGDSKEQAGMLAAQLARTAGSDLSGNLFMSGSRGADDLLYQLGAMSKLTEKTDRIYANAVQDQNTAQALGDQAVVAKDQLAALASAAQEALDASVAAQTALEAKQAEQEQHQLDLEAQLRVLTDQASVTEAQYQVGERKRAEELARQEALRQLAAASSAASGVSGPVSPPGAVSAAGWAAPLGGAFSSGIYGNRFHPIYKRYIFHAGEDLVSGSTCGAPLYAAAAGTVTYSGLNGGVRSGYGYYISIDHGNGLSTAYGHIMPGGLLVGVGQQVSAGQNIALAGTSGGSTGCHLHFEVRINGSSIDPVPFMGTRGVRITSTR